MKTKTEFCGFLEPSEIASNVGGQDKAETSSFVAISSRNSFEAIRVVSSLSYVKHSWLQQDETTNCRLSSGSWGKK